MRKRLLIAASLGFAQLILGTVNAHAEVIVSKPADGWEIYTSGRVGAFGELVHGDAQPPKLDGRPSPTQDGITVQTGPGPNGENNGARATASRVRSGFLGNILNILYNAGAELVINGHEHNYERFAPMRPDGTRDDARGIREIIVGTGGASLRTLKAAQPNSEVRSNAAHGVLKLTLRGDGYRWDFVPIAGKTFTDTGTGTCH